MAPRENKIVWNKVTWYSRILALVLFVAMPFAGFYFGVQYGKTIVAVYDGQTNIDQLSAVASSTVAFPGAEYYNNPSEWQTDTRSDGGFSIAYPLDFPTNDFYSAKPSTDWRANAGNASGLKLFEMDIPAAFEPQTNLADAKLTVGLSRNNAAIADCLEPDQSGGPAVGTSTAVINGITFTVFQFSDAGAGNIYQGTSYRTLHAGACYAVEYTIHSTQIANYPAQYNLQPFNQSQITKVLDRVVGTFKFQ